MSSLDAKSRSGSLRPWILLAIGLVVVLGIPSLFPPIASVDEALTAVVADTVAAGGLPYRDSVDQRGPVTYYFFALIFRVAGRYNMVAIHVAAIALKVVLILLVAALARSMLRPRAAAFAVVSFAFVSSVAFRREDVDALHTEWLVILFTCTGALLLLQGLPGGRSLLARFLAGMCFGMAFLTKQPALFDLVAAVVFLLVLAVARPPDLPLAARALGHAVAVVAGWTLVVTTALSFFYFQDAWSDFVFYFWTYNREYYVAAMPWNKFLGGQVTGIKSVILLPAGVGLLGVFGATVALMRLQQWRKEPPTPQTWQFLYLILWALSASAGTTLGGRAFGHYFIQLFPAACLLAGAGFDLAVQRFAVAYCETRSRLVPVSLVGALVLGFVLLPFGNYAYENYQIHRYLRHDTAEKHLVAFLERECHPDDSVFVWGFNPEVYVLSKRRSASRYSYCTFVAGLVNWANTGREDSRADVDRWVVPGSADRLREDLERSQPLFVIDSSPLAEYGFQDLPLDRWPPLADWLQEHFELDPAFQADALGSTGYRVYRRKSAAGGSGDFLPR